MDKCCVVAIVPGSFDPITNGHIDIIKRASKIFHKVIVGVAKNTAKKSFFDFEERFELTKQVIESLNVASISVEKVEGLLVDFAKSKGAQVIVRGLRAVSDFEYEMEMAFMNRSLAPEIEIIYFMPYIKYSFLSSTIVKDVFVNGGDVSAFVSPIVIEHMKKKFKGER
ncbi:MAG: pantetheine-phosphate adenylyltransferase [Desulfurella sp.]|uniref:pantetheine-phosphate adenylyltransferase n=1 Tax=Desulfurella TaxID=33001 RepID=UPI000CCADE79|nr:pantetheine-phosphate adenylyltransferase [Desulfurella multipotens]PMP64281.1 MAG: pantetheine-phosphate adenylyltransferase [Desulfurella multipotens]